MKNNLITNNLKQGQRISYDVTDIKGKGKIVGFFPCCISIDNNGLPIIGKSYIIEPDIIISNEAYDYTHFVAFENQLSIE